MKWGWISLVLGTVVMVGCTPLSSEFASTKGSATRPVFRGGENLTRGGRYDWIHLTFNGGKYASDPSIISSVTERRFDFRITGELEFEPSVFSDSEVKNIQLGLEESFAGFEVIVDSDRLGVLRPFRFNPARPSTPAPQWDRAVHGDRTIEIVIGEYACTSNVACDQDTDEYHRYGESTFAPFESGRGSPILLALGQSSATKATRTSVHEIGHSLGLYHGEKFGDPMWPSASGISQSGFHLLRHYQRCEMLNRDGSPSDTCYPIGGMQRPMAHIAPAFGVPLTPMIQVLREFDHHVIAIRNQERRLLDSFVFPIPGSMDYLWGAGGDPSVELLILDDDHQAFGTTKSGARLVSSRLEVDSINSPFYRSNWIQWEGVAEGVPAEEQMLCVDDGHVIEQQYVQGGHRKTVTFDCRDLAPLSHCVRKIYRGQNIETSAVAFCARSPEVDLLRP